MSMQKLRLLLFLGLISLFTLTGYAQQPPMPIAGVPNITWGMSPDNVQQIAPGQMAGQILIYNQEWQTYPVNAEYFFANNHLTHVSLIPSYAYDGQQATSAWQREYQAINTFLTTQYGQPYQQQQDVMIWRQEQIQTQATSILFQQGWQVRFEQYRR